MKILFLLSLLFLASCELEQCKGIGVGKYVDHKLNTSSYLVVEWSGPNQIKVRNNKEEITDYCWVFKNPRDTVHRKPNE